MTLLYSSPPLSRDSVTLCYYSATEATSWNLAITNFILTLAFATVACRHVSHEKRVLKLQTHKAVCIQRSSAASSTLIVATLARASTKATTVALRGAHCLCH